MVSRLVKVILNVIMTLVMIEVSITRLEGLVSHFGEKC